MGYKYNEYQSGDVVNYNGSSYVALININSLDSNLHKYLGVSTDPAAKWTILSDGLAGAALDIHRRQHSYRGDLSTVWW